MNFFVFLCLITIICCHRLNGSTVTTSENLQSVHQSVGTSTLTNNDSKREEKQVPWKDLLMPRQNPVKIEDLKRIANTKIDSTNRKTKILGNLAFLAGLSVGSLAGASSNVNTYMKAPPVNFNFGASRLASQLAAIYGPYPYMPQPYVFAAPLGYYPLLNPLGLQSLDGVQNDFQALAQNQQVLNLLENKKSTDLLNNNDEYIEEAKKVENVRTSNDVAETTDGSVELQIEDDRNAEEKRVSPGTPCNLQKGFKKKGSNSLKSASREIEDDGSLIVLDFRADKANATNTNNTKPGNGTVMENSTMINNGTNNPFPYYGGYPQNIHHIEFTTETNKYHEYEHINYNLPSYDKPVNFYSDDRYNYYSNPPVDSSPTNDFHQEQIPEYFSNDFNRFLYPSYNTPPFANNDFRPVV